MENTEDKNTEQAVRKDFVSERLAYLKALKNPSQQQMLFMELAENENRSEEEEKLFELAKRAERLIQKSQNAKNKLSKKLSEKNEAIRKARNHELYKVAGLLQIANLVNRKTGKPIWDRAELLGGLVFLSEKEFPSEQKQTWKLRGSELLSKAGDVK